MLTPAGKLRRRAGSRASGLRLSAAAVVAATTGAIVFVSLLIAVLAGYLGHGSVDAHVETSAHNVVLRSPLLLSLARSLTNAGAPFVVDVIALFGAAVLWLAGRRRAAMYVVAVRVAAQLCESAGKPLIGRARPTFVHPVAHASGYSFPSGHAAGAASVYLPLAVIACTIVTRRAVQATVATAATLVCLTVATTRVLLGLHYPSDVIAGLAVGVALTAILTPILRGAPGANTPRRWPTTDR